MSKPIEMHDLTILLTLKNREVYTKNWLEQNIFPEFSYLIADGSDCDRNRQICLPYVSQNVTYVQYPPDSTYRIYIQKRMAAMSRIGTRFVLSADNDDFLLRDGLNKIMAELKRSPDITLIQGNVGKVQINENGLYKRTADWKHFLGDHGDNLASLKNCLSNYYSLWYSISEVDLQRKILDIFYASGTENPYLVEEFQTFLSLAMAKTKVVPWYYYVRLENPVSSNDSASSTRHRFDQVLDMNYYKSFSHLVHELTKYHDGIDEKALYSLLRDYQISKFVHTPARLGAQLKNALKRKLRARLASLSSEKRVSSHDIPSLFPEV